MEPRVETSAPRGPPHDPDDTDFDMQAFKQTSKGPMEPPMERTDFDMQVSMQTSKQPMELRVKWSAARAG